MMKIVGSRWYKCDLHLHTMQSECYSDRNTAREWMEEAARKGLECLAVTDHNNYKGINEMIELGREYGITVFPGTEITCSDAKVHMLILFDPSEDEEAVHDFLTTAGILRKSIGTSEGTNLSVAEICSLAKEQNALVIAAHIDEFNGISGMGHFNMEELFKQDLLDGVQVVNEALWTKYQESHDVKALTQALSEKYGKPISVETAEEWRKAYQMAADYHATMLTFSDNPCAPGDSHHGLWGIGSHFTYIKMGEKLSLAALRLALLAGEGKVHRDSRNLKTEYPAMWIKSLTLTDSKANPGKPFHLDFNPQLNCIIGGRGSGKSTSIRLLAGGLEALNDQISNEDQVNFYKIPDKKNTSGIFTRESVLEIEVCRLEELYKIVVTQIDEKGNHQRSLYHYDQAAKEYFPVEDPLFIDFLSAQVYTQKEIFEIASEANSLLGIIDRDIEGIRSVKDLRESAYQELLDQLKKIRIKQEIVDSRARIQTELDDLDAQIERYKKSGIADLIEKKQNYARQEQICQAYSGLLEARISEFEAATRGLSFPELPVKKAGMDEEVAKLLQDCGDSLTGEVQLIKNSILKMKKDLEELKDSLLKSNFNLQKEANEKAFEASCAMLTDGLEEAARLDRLIEARKKKQDELDQVERAEEELQQFEKGLKECYKKYLASLDALRKIRMDFITSVLSPDTNVKIVLQPFRKVSSLGHMIHTITQKEGINISNDIEKLEEVVFKGNVMQTIEKFRTILKGLRNGDPEICEDYSSYLRKTLKNLDADLFDKMLAFMPDDDMKVSYRVNETAGYKPISTASAGQKAAAILTFVLSHGSLPLLLDQPEDDLDNKLVYDLIVNRLSKVKENRQIIVVTHNANIPVNGEAEYILAMNAESAYSEVNCTGTLDEDKISEEICNIMEGSENAFKKRAKRYHIEVE